MPLMFMDHGCLFQGDVYEGYGEQAANQVS